jgi:hypothetical protein
MKRCDEASLKESIFTEISNLNLVPEKRGLVVYFRKYRVTCSSSHVIIALGTAFFYNANHTPIAKEKPVQVSATGLKTIPGTMVLFSPLQTVVQLF